VIEHVALRDTLTVSVAYEPWLIGDVTRTRRTLADAAEGAFRRRGRLKW
jgi:hypothetical protein